MHQRSSVETAIKRAAQSARRAGGRWPGLVFVAQRALPLYVFWLIFLRHAVA
jgi:hypothetical protein